MLAIPRRYFARGVRRYGFHGLSCEYLMGELARLAGRKAASGRVVLAHLGNGASITAVRAGKSVDTSMSFTPTAGLAMSTRSGDLDPALAWYFLRSEKLAPKEFNRMVTQESGLLGISGVSGDVRELMAVEKKNAHAAEAVELFCYQARKWVGALSAVLGGVDTLVFAGGIGENNAEVRARICAGLEFLGVKLDLKKNKRGVAVISSPESRVMVRIIRTDEERIIARTVGRLLRHGKKLKD